MPHHRPHRLLLLLSASALAACSSTSEPNPAPVPPPPATTTPPPVISPIPEPTPVALEFTPTSSDALNAWRDDFAPRAQAKGYENEIILATLEGLEPQNRFLRTADTAADQAEFSKPIWEYVGDTVSNSRKRTGARKLSENLTLLQAIETRYGVPKEIVAAIWGMETSYGGYIGDFDAPSALASMATEGRRRSFAEAELFAIMDIISKGEATRADLVAGWAGALGQTQFMPSTYVQHAVDWTGDGRKDVWADTGDALASAANYLKVSGWRVGQPYILEVSVPTGFDYGLADGRDRRIETWAGLGITPLFGDSLTGGGAGFAELWLPAGATGPAYLLFENFNVIKRYNRADSYALSVSLLAESFRDREGPRAPWPTNITPLSVKEVKELQTALNRLGYDAGPVDGIAGRGTRGALQRFQKDRGLAADGFPTREVLTIVLAAS